MNSMRKRATMPHDPMDDWRAVDPRVLLKLDLLYRCPECGCLVVDIDRCRHAEHHAATAA
jgi:hypothetical protein